jgi:hypothetical protein
MDGGLDAGLPHGALPGEVVTPLGDGEQRSERWAGQLVEVAALGGVEHFADELPAHRGRVSGPPCRPARLA